MRWFQRTCICFKLIKFHKSRLELTIDVDLVMKRSILANIKLCISVIYRNKIISSLRKVFYTFQFICVHIHIGKKLYDHSRLLQLPIYYISISSFSFHNNSCFTIFSNSWIKWVNKLMDRWAGEPVRRWNRCDRWPVMSLTGVAGDTGGRWTVDDDRWDRWSTVTVAHLIGIDSIGVSSLWSVRR